MLNYEHLENDNGVDLEELTQEKTAIVLSGGGMSSAYSQGALHTLRTHFNYTDPDLVIGSSGGAGNAAYYVANQTHEGNRVWLEEITGERFIKVKGPFGKSIDIDYLVDEIFRKMQN